MTEGGSASSRPVTLVPAIAVVVGMSLGFLAAYKRGTWVDVSSMVLAIVGVSMPHFWLGLLLLFLFALQLQWLPVAGATGGR